MLNQQELYSGGSGRGELERKDCGLTAAFFFLVVRVTGSVDHEITSCFCNRRAYHSHWTSLLTGTAGARTSALRAIEQPRF